MGIPGWYPFLRKKGYEPMVLQQSAVSTTRGTSTRRLDFLSSYSIIKDAYTHNSVDKAHEILEEHARRFGTKDILILYIDGAQAIEKSETAKVRQEIRNKAKARCEKSLSELEYRIDNNIKPRKRHFTDIKTNLATTFYWTLTMREAFIHYMQEAGWKVRMCETEADLAVAQDCEPDDIVISADSDMLAYSTVSTLWRPVSRSVFLVYELEDVRRTLGFTKAQLTALAVVSKNDYGKNIYSLGPATNYSIIKSIQGEGTRDTIAEYLRNPQVVSKNEESKTFELAIRVFVDLKQTPVTSDLSVVGPSTYGVLRRCFMELSARYEQQKETLPAPQTSSGKNQIVRLHSSQSCIRYKTVESPAMLKPGSAVPGSLSPQPPAPRPLSPQPQQFDPTPQEDPTISLSSHESNGHPALPRTRLPRHQQRYSFKTRTGETKHPAPEKMKLYKFKPYKERTDTAEDVTNNESTQSKVKAKPTLKTLEGSSASSRKLSITRLMAYQHPTSSLGVGTLWANTGRAVRNDPNLQGQVVQCVRDAICDAASTKRKGQRVIGRFIEHVNCMGPQLDDADRVFLDLLCPRVTKKDAKCYKDGNSEDDDGEGDDTCLGVSTTLKMNNQQSFLLSFLTHLYSGNYPRAQGIGQKVNDFIDRLSRLGLYSPPRPRQAINEKTPFTPTDLLESVMGQLRVELKKMYKNGSCDLYQKLKTLKTKGLLGPNIDIGIQEDLSAVENYLILNRLSRSPRRIIPLTSSKQPFISFSERQLAGFFYGHGRELRTRLQTLVQGPCTSIKDAQEWIARKEPGFLIKRFLVDIDPTNLTVRKRGKLGHRAAIKLWTFDQLEDHLRMLDDKDFLPETYTSKGYVPRGSIRTNGFSLQVLCFKRKELLSVKYKRLPDGRLPLRLTSTLHGTSDNLTEIRNVLATKDDVARLWPDIDPRDIKTLTLDAGQAFVVGAYAHLPQAGNKDKSPSFKGSFSLASSSASTPQDLIHKVTLEQQVTSTPPMTSDLNKTPHYNLAVNQKAVMQPVFRYRRWLEDEKRKIPDDQLESIADIESSLPPLRGHEASVTNYIERLGQVEDRLLGFYNGNDNRFKKHTWDMERAKHIEYQAIANSLLGIVGGSIGEHRKEDNRVLIGVGLGQFGSSSRLSSLHSSFLSYFVPLARSLGYIVVGLNEFYTSKKCPNCQEFVAQVTLRELFCPHCGKYHHRDVMAAQNMSNIVRGYIENQKRPRYLQPMTADGRYPWEEDTIMTTTTSSSSTNDAGTSSSSAPPRGCKRTSSVSNLSRKRDKRKDKEA